MTLQVDGKLHASLVLTHSLLTMLERYDTRTPADSTLRREETKLKERIEAVLQPEEGMHARAYASTDPRQSQAQFMNDGTKR